MTWKRCQGVINLSRVALNMVSFSHLELASFKLRLWNQDNIMNCVEGSYLTKLQIYRIAQLTTSRYCTATSGTWYTTSSQIVQLSHLAVFISTTWYELKDATQSCSSSYWREIRPRMKDMVRGESRTLFRRLLYTRWMPLQCEDTPVYNFK